MIMPAAKDVGIFACLRMGVRVTIGERLLSDSEVLACGPSRDSHKTNLNVHVAVERESIPLNMSERNSVRFQGGDEVMITLFDLGPVPTVHLFVQVMVPLKTGGWAWGKLPQFSGELARDFAYSAEECQALVHVFGNTMPLLVPRKELGARFSICARGSVTGVGLGLREWDWCPIRGAYHAEGEYLCGWREGVRALYLKTGEYIEDQTFRAKATRQAGATELTGGASALMAA
ncbi:hypothetical protein [Streptomyces sp. NBC_01500]|uniref:hypothetical protein n=1 Tax=Streptomyces sp. NBC_01500 TaxID=2903886 RepID=UPI002257CFE9|nr:hypothetical protein [Streptomyces sp. NBC_01500]MCX4554176.1 hypothetical protein [Streptomyces sp. NBC_01500]MCX4554516.1 hypothetical protein [Streptomyces sp. NBC_01500]